MKEIKPTMREVRVALDSMGISQDDIGMHFNDLRKNGGRIKFYTRNNITHGLVELERRLGDMFPKWDIRVTPYPGRRGSDVTVHFKDIRKELLGTPL